ncbi:hypothetical protein KR093_008195 [Drosophila rubida]|uniref:SCP domain-containing protein n=1 Tax=Drosophila rubida TaxID=30044 RepID=A0AAD4JU39_9MUSC|nr:hypothetical protein KR093_008195 [Drosophila rubida]
MRSLFALLLVIFSMIDELCCISTWDRPVFKTRVSNYKMHGDYKTPKPLANFCDKKLCPPGVMHIACSDLFWGANCPKPREGVNMEKVKVKIIDMHNAARHRLTSSPPLGQLPMAKPFPEIYWDEELSVVAMRVTNHCNDKAASECVNTPRYLNVAKVSVTKSRKAASSAESVLVNSLGASWFAHSKEFPAAYVMQFPANASSKDVSFGTIINKRVTKVGCGMLIKKNSKDSTYHLTCLYNEKPKPGQPLYDLQD